MPETAGRILLVVLALIAGLAIAALADWTYATPEDHDMSSPLLEQMRELIDEADLPIDSVIVLRGGDIVFEHFPNLSLYRPNIPHNLYSTTKSITSILIGIAIEMGFIEDVDQPVIDFFPNRQIRNLDARKRRMTLEHLLTMTSGLEWEGPDDMHHSWGAGIRSGDPVQYALDRPMAHEPGEVFYYNGGCSHLLSAILTEATGMSTLDFAQEHLFGPLDILRVIWPRDPNGVYYGGQDIHLTPHAMAKIGQLFLNGGLWEDERIVPAEWVAASWQPHTVTWSGTYGYQWWHYPESGVFYASGAFEQRILVIPNYDMVVVFTASNMAPGVGPGERDVGPQIVEWLFSRFILPACDDFEPQPFGDYGFTLSIPHLLQEWTSGGPGVREASRTAGLSLFSYDGSPYERLGIRWMVQEPPYDPSAALGEFVGSLRAFGVQIESVGAMTEAPTPAGTATCQPIDIAQEHGLERAYIGTLPCSEEGLSIVVYVGIPERFTPWIEPVTEVAEILGSLQYTETE